MSDQRYLAALEAVRQLRELGAVWVRVGDVEAEFGSPTRRSLDPAAEVMGDAPESPEEKAIAAAKAWEQEQYFSAGTLSPQLASLITGRRS